MASALYPLGKQALLTAGFNLSTDTIKAALVDTGTYTYSAAHQYYSSVSSTVQGTPVQLTSPTVNSPSAGVFDAADTTFSAVSGLSIEAVVIYKDTGSAATSPLLAYIDGISVQPSGGDIIIVWDNGTSRIFAL